MELLWIAGFVIIFLGVTGSVKRLCRKYLRKQEKNRKRNKEAA